MSLFLPSNLKTCVSPLDSKNCQKLSYWGVTSFWCRDLVVVLSLVSGDHCLCVLECSLNVFPYKTSCKCALVIAPAHHIHHIGLAQGPPCCNSEIYIDWEERRNRPWIGISLDHFLTILSPSVAIVKNVYITCCLNHHSWLLHILFSFPAFTTIQITSHWFQLLDYDSALPSLGTCFIFTKLLTISMTTATLMEVNVMCCCSGSWSLCGLRLGMIVASFIDNLSDMTLHKRRLYFLLCEAIWVSAFEVTPRVFTSFDLLLPVFTPIVAIVRGFVTRMRWPGFIFGYIKLK